MMTAATIANDFRAERDAMQKLLSGYRRSLVSHGWLIVIPAGTPNGTLAVLSPTFDGNTVTSVQFSSVTRATRLTKQDAERLCHNGNIRNGNGQVAVPMHQIDAVSAHIACLDHLIATLEKE